MKWIVEIDVNEDIGGKIQNVLEEMVESMNENGELKEYYPSVNVETIEENI